MMSASPSLAELAKSYEITRKRSPRSIADLPSSTPEAEAFAKPVKSQGYRFVGPTSVVLGRIGRRAIRGREDVSAEEAMTLGPSTVQSSARLEAEVERMRRQKLTNLPVTTSDGRLLGNPDAAERRRALRRLGR